jgi:hypothetical protein
MKRTLVAVALLIAVSWAIIAFAVETNYGGPVDHGLICTGAETSVYFYSARYQNMPTAYTLYSKDATVFSFKRRFKDGINDTIAIVVPAGSSILVPAPDAISLGDSFSHTIFIGDHSDTVYAMPWYK